MLYDTRLCYFREDWRCVLRTYDKFSVRGCSDVDMMLDSPWFIDSAKIGSGARCDTGAYDIDKTLCLLGDPQPAIVSATAFRGIDMPAGNKVDIDCCNYNWVIILE